MGFICFLTFVASLFLKANKSVSSKEKSAKDQSGFVGGDDEEELLDWNQKQTRGIDLSYQKMTMCVSIKSNHFL